MAKLLNNPRNVSLRNNRVLAVRPEALGVELLECALRKFEAALPDFLSLFHRAHHLEAKPFSTRKQAGTLQRSIFLERLKKYRFWVLFQPKGCSISENALAGLKTSGRKT